MTDKPGKTNIFGIVRRVFALCYSARPFNFIMVLGLSTLNGLTQGLDVFVNQMFFDAVYNASVGNGGLSAAFLMLAAYIGVNVGLIVLNAVSNFARNVSNKRISGYLTLRIADKAHRIDPVLFEDPEHLDAVNKAFAGSESAVWFNTSFSTLFTFYLPYLIFMSVYLFTLKPLLLFAILLIFVPVILSRVLRTTVFTELEDKSAPLRRESDAYRSAVCDLAFNKETRNLGAYGHFKRLLTETVNSMNRELEKTCIRAVWIDNTLRLLSMAGYIGIIFLLVYYLLNGGITVGAFAAIYASIGKMTGIILGIVYDEFGGISEFIGPIRNFLNFLDIPVKDLDENRLDKKGDIVMNDVFFRYPNAERDCLTGINLTVKNGETVAIVGENGAGKTTLVRIMTGIYRPVTGSVTINGEDIANYSYRAVFEKISGVFQNFRRYLMTLNKNVQISDYKDETDVSEALNKSGVDVCDSETFPHGLETVVSREFDGVDVSGGIWQRIAIARGLYRSSDIVVLDEPTAAIDPLEERALYRRFTEITRGKTAVIVTHRMGSVRIADRIIVMKDGRIVQTGTHDGLLESGGVYAEMYRAQAEWYEKT